jgi:hypothetical protein
MQAPDFVADRSNKAGTGPRSDKAPAEPRSANDCLQDIVMKNINEARMGKEVKPKATTAPRSVHCAKCERQVQEYVVHANGKPYCSKCYNRGTCTVCGKKLTLFDKRSREENTRKLYCAQHTAQREKR